MPHTRQFVIHDHNASHHHFDFRLERYGVLKSWALPKGMPLKIGDKRLAVPTPNHPMTWLTFHGTIPKGEYGAGTVKIADTGLYTTYKWDQNEVDFVLHGKKYKGQYYLIKTGENWLLIKAKSKIHKE